MRQAKASDQAERTLLYECDYYTWALVNAAAIRERRLEHVDLDNVAAEIEDLGKSQESALESHLKVVLLHLLKLQHQPRRSTRSGQLHGERTAAGVAKSLTQESRPAARNARNPERRLPRSTGRRYAGDTS